MNRLPERWDRFPPQDSEARLKDYEKNRLLFKGKHEDVYSRIQAWIEKEADKAIVYIIVNFAGLLSKISADLLFGEMIRVVTGDEESKEQLAMDQIVLNNSLHTRNYEMALSCSWRGDSVYKVRFGRPKSWKDNQVIIESVPASIFFPHLNGDNIQEMTGCTLAWTKKFDDKLYLRKEIHEPGTIMNELWLMDGSKNIKRQVPLNTIPEYAGLPEVEETQYPGLLVVHVPNWRLDDEFFGMSDYYDMESLFDEMNNRVSKVSRILDKHSDPKLILPPGIMRYDESTRRYYVDKEDLQCIEVEPTETGDLPKYLVWDAQLEAAFKQLDHLVELAMMVSETSPASFGMDKEGKAESGRALKFKLLRTLAKINRKKIYFDEALKEVLYIAQFLDVTYGRGSYEPKDPRIEWADGLPQDMVEQSEVESNRITAGNTSVESSIRRLDGLDGKALKDELKRIEDEKKASNPAVARPQVTLPSAGGGQGGSQ